ncbi:tetratricopeptide repeat protein [Janthinobacterium sp. GB1R12]|uniref:O-linked N-acetylglucosamine transferase, SPINDLY family protein n=1 Tax=Janthinobacterium sp. GB1R12 TaxID=3424190 RepID=UPI003F23FF53
MMTDTAAGNAAGLPEGSEIALAVAQAILSAETHLLAEQFSEAEQLYKAVLQLSPLHAEANRQLGLLALKAAEVEASLPFFAAALEARPDLAAGWLDYIEALILAGQHETARQVLRFGRERGLDNIWADQLARRLNEREAAVSAADVGSPGKFSVGDGQGAVGHLEDDLGALFEQGRYAEVEVGARALTRRQPRDGYCWKLLGAALQEQRRSREALPCMQKAARLLPGDAEAQHNLGLILQELGNMTAAENACRNALTMAPGLMLAHSNLILMQNYHSRTTPAKRLAEARRFGQEVSRQASGPFTAWSCSKQPQRLRIGMVSADLRNHPVGLFLEALLAALDPRRVELIAYPTVLHADAVTARLRPHFAAWRPISGMANAAAAQLIESDGVHVLFDLGGHTGNNRLPVFAWRPAPVQVSWLGYFATTGMAEMDYLLADPHVAPLGEEGEFTETLWRMPDSYLCFTEPREEVSVTPLPALSNGYVTFGCFNNLAKMTDAVVALWSRVLKAVPDSRLSLKTKQLDDAAVRARTLARFAAHGISAERISMSGTGTRLAMLEAYQHVDIALDPFPYPGGTTSMETLWMAVPIVTRRGTHFLSHLGESILLNAGLPAWIASDDDDYVAVARRFAGDVDALAALRGGLRQQVVNSPLYDARRFARHFEDAVWGMWHDKSKKLAESCGISQGEP